MGSYPSLTLLLSVPHLNHCCKPSPLQACWEGLPNPPSAAGLLFTARESKCPSLSLELRVPLSLCYVSSSVAYYTVFVVVVLVWSFGGERFSLSRGYAGLSQGWLWQYHVSLTCSPVGLHLPSRLGASTWQCGSPPGFSI
jgi:hypothetical protein